MAVNLTVRRNIQYIKVLKAVHSAARKINLKLVCAGGAVSSLLMCEQPKDFDLFVIGEIPPVDVFQCLTDSIDRDEVSGVIYQQGWLITIIEDATPPIQIILRPYAGISELLHGFDIPAACLAYDIENNKIYGTTAGIFAYHTRTNFVDLRRLSPSFASRLAKYYERGYAIAVVRGTVGDQHKFADGLLSWRCLETAGRVRTGTLSVSSTAIKSDYLPLDGVNLAYAASNINTRAILRYRRDPRSHYIRICDLHSKEPFGRYSYRNIKSMLKLYSKDLTIDRRYGNIIRALDLNPDEVRLARRRGYDVFPIFLQRLGTEEQFEEAQHCLEQRDALARMPVTDHPWSAAAHPCPGGPEWWGTPPASTPEAGEVPKTEPETAPSDEFMCTICHMSQPSYSRDGACTPCCRARYHFSCLYRWASSKHSCPHCRSDFGTKTRVVPLEIIRPVWPGPSS